MELIMILFVIMVVFNAVNAAIQKSRGSSQAQPLRVVRNNLPAAGEEPRERLHFAAKERRQAPPEPQWAEGKTLEWRSDDAQVEPPPAPGGVTDVQTGAVAAGLARILHHRSDLVAAFIFHEVMERPRALRGR